MGEQLARNQVQVALRSTILSFLFPQVPKEFYRGWPISRVVIVRIRQYLEVSRHELPEQFDPICEVLAAVNDSLVPSCRLFFDSLSVLHPPHNRTLQSNHVKPLPHLPT